VRGNLWFSANTAGTEVCTCDESVFERCSWYVPGKLWFYQCPPASNDKFTGCTIYAGAVDPYKAPKTTTGRLNMPGVTVAGFVAAAE
jgi:hypothetical protein